MPKQGPGLKSVIKSLRVLGQKVDDNQEFVTKQKLKKWIDEASAENAEKLWRIIEQDWIDYLLNKEREQEGQKPFAAGQNSHKSLPQWFYRELFAKCSETFTKSMLQSPMQVKLLCRATKKFHEKFFFFMTAAAPQEPVPKGTVPSDLLEVIAARVRAVGDRSRFIVMDDEGGIDWVRSGPFQLMGHESSEDQVRVKHVPSGQEVTLCDKWDAEWVIVNAHSEQEAVLTDGGATQKVCWKLFPKKLFAYPDAGGPPEVDLEQDLAKILEAEGVVGTRGSSQEQEQEKEKENEKEKATVKVEAHCSVLSGSKRKRVVDGFESDSQSE